jgi:hypothetical protein
VLLAPTIARIKVCLAGLLFSSDSDSSREVLPNVVLEKPFLSEKQRSQSRFGKATNYGFSKTALSTNSLLHQTRKRWRMVGNWELSWLENNGFKWSGGQWLEGS